MERYIKITYLNHNEICILHHILLITAWPVLYKSDVFHLSLVYELRSNVALSSIRQIFISENHSIKFNRNVLVSLVASKLVQHASCYLCFDPKNESNIFFENIFWLSHSDISHHTHHSHRSENVKRNTFDIQSGEIMSCLGRGTDCWLSEEHLILGPHQFLTHSLQCKR
jgi:hypothetical protein